MRAEPMPRAPSAISSATRPFTWPISAVDMGRSSKPAPIWRSVRAPMKEATFWLVPRFST